MRRTDSFCSSESETYVEIDKKFISEVFSLELPTPNPPFTHSFLNLVPKTQENPKKISIMDPDSIIACFHLDYTERFIILSSIEENKSMFLLSEENKEYAGIIILQCICAVQFYDCSHFDSETSRLYISLIEFIIEIFPGHDNLLAKAFEIVYNMMNKSYSFLDILDSIIKISEKLPLSGPKIADLHLTGIVTLLRTLKHKSLDKRGYNAIAKKIITFINAVKNSLEEKSENLSKNVDKLFFEVVNFDFLSLWDNSGSFNSMNRLHLILLSLCIRLAKFSGKKFAKFSEIIRTIINCVPLQFPKPGNIIPRRISTSTLEGDDEYDCLPITELLRNKENTQETDFSLPVISSMQNFLENTKHPIYYVGKAFEDNEVSFAAFETLVDDIQSTETCNYYILLYYLVLHSKITPETVFTSFSNEIFFPSVLFFTRITIFNYSSCADEEKEKALLLFSARNLAISSVIKFARDSFNEDAIIILITYLNNIIKVPDFFTEVFYYSQNIVSHVIQNQKYYISMMNTITKELVYQQKDISKKGIKAKITREFFLQILLNIMYCMNTVDPNITCSLVLYKILLLVVFDCSISKYISQILKLFISNILRNFIPECGANLFLPIVCKITQAAKYIKQTQKPLKNFINILLESLNKNYQTKELFRRSFCENGYLDCITPIISIDGVEDDVILDILRLQSIETNYGCHNKQINYENVSKIISKIGMTQEMYEIVLSIISGNDKKIVGIENQESTPLIASIVESDFCVPFLQDLDELAEKSIPARFELYSADILSYLFKVADNTTDDKVIDLCFSVFEKIAKFIADKRIFIELIQHMEAKPGNKQSKLLHVIFNYFLLMSANIQEKENETFSMFSKCNGKIVLPNVDFTSQHGFTTLVSLQIRISGMEKESFINLFNFSNIDGDFICCDLFFDKIVINSSMFDSIIEFPVEIKQNEWISFGLELKNNYHTVTLFYGNNKKEEQPKNRKIPTSVFTKCFLFDDCGDVRVRGQFKKFAIFATPPVDTLSYNDMIIIDGVHSHISSLFFSTKNIRGRKMINANNESYAEIKNGYIYRDVASFWKIFIKENGLDYVIRSISQIDYPLENGDMNHKFAMNFIDTIVCLLSSSKEIHERMLKIDGFAVIAHFLSTSKTVELDKAFWLKVCQIGYTLDNTRLLASFYINIALNFSIWKKCDLDTLFQIFSYWKSSASNNSDIFFSALPVIKIIRIIDYLFKRNELNEENAALLSEILISVSIASFNPLEFNLILDLVKKIGTFNNFTSIFIDAIISNLDHNTQVFDQISEEIINSEWISEISDACLLRKIAAVFVQAYDDKCTSFFLIQMKLAKKRMLEGNVDQNNKLLIDFCNLLFSENNCTIEEILSNMKGKIINVDILPFIISIVFYSDEKHNLAIMKMLNSIFGYSDACLTLVSSLKTISILQFCILAIQYRNYLFDSFALFVSTSPKMLRIAFGFLDAIENATNSDLSDFLLLLFKQTVALVFNAPNKSNLEELIKVFVSRICFVPKEKKKLDQEMMKEPLDIIDSIKTCVPYEYVFGVEFDKNNKWMNAEGIIVLIDMMIRNQNCNFDSTLVPFSLLFSQEAGFAKRESAFLDIIFEKSSKTIDVWAPVIYQIAKLQELNDTTISITPSFAKCFSTKLKLSVDLFSSATDAYSRFVQNSVTPENDVKELMHLLAKKDIKNVRDDASINEIINAEKKMSAARANELENAWIVLDKSLSPFEFSTEFKRSPHYNIHFNNQVKIPCTNYKDFNKAVKIIVSSDDLLLDKKAYRIFPDGVKEAGQFAIRPDAVIFVGAEKTSCYIYSYSIRFIFQDPTNKLLQIFDDNGSLYVIQLIDCETSTVVDKIAETDVSKALFIQKGSAKAEVKNALMKWQAMNFPSFDLLMFVNLLSGRSFNIPERYPTFPNFFYDESSNANEEGNNIIKKLQTLDDLKSRESLPPEYFFDFALYEGVDLGMSVDEFATNINNKLESDDWYKWFEKHFPDLCPLPNRTAANEFSFGKLEKFIDLPSAPISLSFVNGNVFAILSNSSFYCSANNEVLLNNAILPTDPRRISFFEADHSLFSSHNDSESKPGMFAFSPDMSSDVCVFDGEIHSFSSSSPHLSPIQCIGASFPYIVTCGCRRDMLVSLFSFEDGEINLKSTMCLHKEGIECCAISSGIGLVATASSDGTLIISRIPDLYPLRKMTIDGIPKSLIFTKFHNFLILVYEHFGKTTITTMDPNFYSVSSRTFDNKVKSVTATLLGFREAIIVHEKCKDSDEFHACDAITMKDMFGSLTTSDIINISLRTTSSNPQKIVLNSGNSVFTASVF